MGIKVYFRVYFVEDIKICFFFLVIIKIDYDKIKDEKSYGWIEVYV